jgi:3D (Asp-Asp-Asp) domain-containing protein
VLKENYRLKGKYWRRVRVPLIAVAFLGLLCYSHWSQTRIADVADTAAPIVSAPEILEAEYERELSELTDFHATAYCDAGITRSGEETRHGYVAADPKVIPLGSMIYIDSPLMGGVYQVMDTGSKVKGRIVDIFLPGYERCMVFGRRMVKVKVLRYGFAGE